MRASPGHTPKETNTRRRHTPTQPSRPTHMACVAVESVAKWSHGLRASQNHGDARQSGSLPRQARKQLHPTHKHSQRCAGIVGVCGPAHQHTRTRTHAACQTHGSLLTDFFQFRRHHGQQHTSSSTTTTAGAKAGQAQLRPAPAAAAAHVAAMGAEARAGGWRGQRAARGAALPTQHTTCVRAWQPRPRRRRPPHPPPRQAAAATLQPPLRNASCSALLQHPRRRQPCVQASARASPQASPGCAASATQARLNGAAGGAAAAAAPSRAAPRGPCLAA